MKCIGQFTTFVCPSRTRRRVRLVHTKIVNSPLQFTQRCLCEDRKAHGAAVHRREAGGDLGSEGGRVEGESSLEKIICG